MGKVMVRVKFRGQTMFLDMNVVVPRSTKDVDPGLCWLAQPN